MAAGEQVRDLEADLAIIEAATPLPYSITRCSCADPVCNQYFISITRSEGRLSLEDATFIVEARTGWPYAIRRAMAAEAEIDRLRNELNILQERFQQYRRCSR